MGEFRFPWLEFSILMPLAGAIVVSTLKDYKTIKRFVFVLCLITFGLTSAEWIEFAYQSSTTAHDGWDLFDLLFHRTLFVIDHLNAPLLPLVALTYLVTIISSARTDFDRRSIRLTLINEALVIAIVTLQASWLLVILLIASVIPAWLEMRRMSSSARVYMVHMGLFALLLMSGYAIQSTFAAAESLGTGLVAAACLIRCGIVPVHCWVTDLFERISFRTAMLSVTPLVGAYGLIRLVLPYASSDGLQTIAILSTATAVYCAGLALIQTEARRFFCYLFLSNASLVLVGLELATPVGLTGALCVWLSVVLSLTGFAITLMAVESRLGRISLNDYHGLIQLMPMLAAFFLLNGLASIGFPGTIGFIAMEMLIEGAVGVSPFIACFVLLAAALNGIAVVKVYFRIFTGHSPTISINLRAQPKERFAVVLLSCLIIGGGLFPQIGVASRYRAAKDLIEQIESPLPNDPQTNHHSQSTLSEHRSQRLATVEH